MDPAPEGGYHGSASLPRRAVLHSIPTADSGGRARYLRSPEEHTPRDRAGAFEKLPERTPQTNAALLTAPGSAGAAGKPTQPACQPSSGEAGACLPCDPGAPAPGCHSAGSRRAEGRSHRTASLPRSAAPAGTSCACLSFSGVSGGSRSGTFSSALRSLRFFPQT